ncbi:zinc finger protein 419-like [Entelurus aequoreus]|uniref:zinc finger protein 419-like n=1 Tax=Entelurus aequoreus TaxID=161455 RepID=UPI002B1E6D2E|nr:zinc finger protein 419-like [Entelurus aequoreus]
MASGVLQVPRSHLSTTTGTLLHQPECVRPECSVSLGDATELPIRREAKCTLSELAPCPFCEPGSSLQHHECDRTCLAVPPARMIDIPSPVRSPSGRPRHAGSSPDGCAPCGGHADMPCPPQDIYREPSHLADARRTELSPPTCEDSEVSGPGRPQVCPRTFRAEVELKSARREVRVAPLIGSKKPTGGVAPGSRMFFRSASEFCAFRKAKQTMKARTKGKSASETTTTLQRRQKKSYPCRVCGKLFLHHLSLDAHYTATSCVGAAHKSKAKEAHLTEHTPNHRAKTGLPGRPTKAEEARLDFPCPSCTKVFPLQSQLREHAQLHDSSQASRECSVCAQEVHAFKRAPSRRKRSYHCLPCREGFSALDSFLEHCQEHLRARGDDEEEEEEDGVVMAGYKHQDG